MTCRCGSTSSSATGRRSGWTVPNLSASTRRRVTLAIAGVGAAAALVVASAVHVPYVILSPGPTLNTLGNGPGGAPILQISGHRTYRATGHLNMVTVSYQGG